MNVCCTGVETMSVAGVQPGYGDMTASFASPSANASVGAQAPFGQSSATSSPFRSPEPTPMPHTPQQPGTPGTLTREYLERKQTLLKLG